MKIFSSKLLAPMSLAIGLASAAVQANAPAASAAMGKGLYEQTGSNSCSYCHGIDGNGGKIAAAAKLSEPKTWKSYKALGGDAAFGKDSKKFLANLEDALVEMIQKGAIAFNASYKKPHYDFKAAGGQINAQMLGLGGAPSTAWLNKFKDRGVTKAIAAKSAYLHVQTLDKQGVFKKLEP